MTVITMSRNELTRLRVVIDVADGRLSVADATGLIGVGRRQVYRLMDAFRAHGADGLISRKRGGPSNRALGTVFRETVLAIVRERYADFGPTLAAEKLCELHGLNLGIETLRQWMIDAGLWVRRKDRLKRIHQPRTRRDCLGELVQIDGSEHWWFVQSIIAGWYAVDRRLHLAASSAHVGGMKGRRQEEARGQEAELGPIWNV